MGNTLNGIKYYMGYNQEQPILNPNELNTQIESDRALRLEAEIESLRQQIDQNKDQIVTKEELNSYFDILTNKIDNNDDGKISQSELEQYVQSQLNQSNQEVEKWKQAYELLHEKYEALEDRIRSEQAQEVKISQISNQALKDYIKSEIIETDANLKLIPDAAEKRIYLTLLKTIMKSLEGPLEGLFNTTSVDVLNHRISIAINPIPESNSYQLNNSEDNF